MPHVTTQVNDLLPTVYTVLLVDGCCEDRNLYCCYLKQDPRYSYAVNEFETGAEVLQWCQHNQPDLVLLDYELPDMNGVELLRQLKQSQIQPVPVIIITRQENPEIAVEAMKQGAADYLLKGHLTIEKLMNAIGDVLACHSKFPAGELQQEKQKLTAAAAALQESEERFRGIFEQSPIGLAMSEVKTGKFIRVNSMFSQITGYSTAELLQMSYLDITHRDDLSTERDLAYQVLNQNLCSASFEKRYITKSGDVSWVNVVSTVVCDVSGNPIYVLGIVENIDDRKQLEATQKQVEEHLRQTNEQLAKANLELAHATQLKNDFLANMSHELRTPLNAVLGMTEGLQDEVFGAINERQRNALARVESSARHLLELINDILDLSKIEAGKLELQFAAVPVERLCQTSLSVVEQQAERKNIALQTIIQPGLGKIAVDERRMRQVLINLLNNAVKFTPHGGRVTLRVWLDKELDKEPDKEPDKELDKENDRQCINFSVIDTGIGIAPEQISKLFKPFVQVDSSLNRQYSGTGLGLALVRRLVDLHSGCVTLTSKVNQGSCFTVHLPYASSKSILGYCQGMQTAQSLNQWEWLQNTEAIEQPLAASELPESIESPLILLVEDEPANVETFCSYLTARGYRLIIAHDGREAVTMATRFKPALILMDIQLPLMDGIEATQQIRTNPELQQTPIIAMTALAMPDDRERCLQAGLDHYLTKPVRLKHLAEIIQQTLNESSL